jgi:hypothetical protein
MDVTWICVTCGTQFNPTPSPPPDCPICCDERQYVGFAGQQWASLPELRSTHRNSFVELEPGLTAIFTEPRVAIGQRALFIESRGGNVLWDCLSLIDEPTVEWIRTRGGISAIAISHPHYYASMVEWSRAFEGVPVYLHRDDAGWVMRQDECLRFWSGDTHTLQDSLTLIRCGGHFAGGAVLHWPAGAGGTGALLTGDIIQVVPDRRWVSFLYSYPNLIPLGRAAVEHIIQILEPFEFANAYGAFHPLQVIGDAKGAIRRSADRYIQAIEGEWPEAPPPSALFSNA